jgi:hypothetical protein
MEDKSTHCNTLPRIQYITTKQPKFYCQIIGAPRNLSILQRHMPASVGVFKMVPV